MIYLKKLPERQKDPETCCPSVKKGNVYINPWPSATHRKATYRGLLSKRLSGYFTSSLTAKEKNLSLMVDLDLMAIKDYHEDEKNIAMQLTWLGHSAFLLQTSPLNFIGPYRCRDRGFKSFSELPPIDFIILSHNHYDHLDKATIKEIYAEEQNKQHTHIFCPLDLKAWFVGLGIPENQVTECDWWDDYEALRLLPNAMTITNEEALSEALSESSHKKITISAVPAQHFSGRTGLDFNETLWVGWVVKSQEASYYFVGDTGYRSIPDDCPEDEIEKYPFCPVFKQIGNIYGPFDIATIPIGPFTPANRMT
ncbi:Metallo-hydrolase/oxidoreductase, partial [Neocallimastix californiae]